MARARPTAGTAARRALADAVLEGYPNGPGAPLRATARAMENLDGAETLVLVEGVSDQIALETAARGRGRRLEAEGVAIVPIGGAHAIARVLASLGGLGGLGTTVRLAGLCDAGEQEIWRRALVLAGVVPTRPDLDLEQHGFFSCVDDLEDELIRAVGVGEVEALLESQGDLGSFRSLQNQPAWRGRAPEAQLRRFLGSGSRRKLRYARLLVDAAISGDRLPRPLDAVLTSCE